MTNSVPSQGSDPQKDPNHPEGSWEAIRKWFRKYLFQVLFFVGGLALYLLLGLFLWWLLQLYVDPSAIEDPSKEATAKKDLLQALGFIMAGVAGVIGIYFTWRGQRLTQESTQEELRITREGQITERFTRAIDQLGKVDDKGKKLFEIRVGGIYALERIAKESEEDYWPIMEILTAYVRQNAPWPPEAGQEGTDGPTEGRSVRDGIGQKSKTTDPLAPNPDIQAIMAVLRGLTVLRRPFQHPTGESERLDLRETNLTRANLEGANLDETMFDGANLDGARFWKASLENASFKEANLTRAILVDANLSFAFLRRANLSEARLHGADLYFADVRGADFSKARELDQHQLEHTHGDETTKLPSDL